jgi:hypothetical protein
LDARKHHSHRSTIRRTGRLDTPSMSVRASRGIPRMGEAVPNTGGLAELVMRRLNAEPGEPPQGMVRRR